MAKSNNKRRRGFGGFVAFRVFPLVLCLVALAIGVFKAAPDEVARFVGKMPDPIRGILVASYELNWLVVIVIAVVAIVIAFVGSLMMRGQTIGGESSWRDGVKIDRTKCAKTECRRMRFAGKLLCPECWDEWKNQQPLRCAQCGDASIKEDTSNPLCKLCHQRWLET